MNILLKRLPCALACCLFLLILGFGQLRPLRAQEPVDRATSADWEALPAEIQAKVDPRILAELRGESAPAIPPSSPQSGLHNSIRAASSGKTRFILLLKAEADLAALDERVYASVADRRAAVVTELMETAARSQAPLKAVLAERQRRSQVTGYQPFYIVNAIAVEGDLDTVVELAQRDDIDRVVASYPLLRMWDKTLKGTGAGNVGPPPADPPPADPTSHFPWNITQVGADRVWRELGITGQGAVVGGFDTGVNYRHPALASSYRGVGDGGLYRHDYNWFEPGPQLYANGNLGPSKSAAPYDCDYDSHGTHTMGTMVGAGGPEEYAIGVAPGARWIAVPGICWETMPGTGLADDIGGLKAFQWFLCPTDLSGTLASADCSQAPDVINNSWGTSNPVNDIFRPAIAALRAAGATVVFSAGNVGRPGSIGSPAHLAETITVGATTVNDDLTPFSSRGPAFHNLELKPNVSAPGDSVVSATGSSGYSFYSGTSMAAPHVAGLIALLVAADLVDGERNLNVDELEAFLTNTAVDLGEFGPDVGYGHGRIDAYQAVRWALSAGDLRGQLRDQQSNAPIADAEIRGHDLNTGETFTGMADGSGVYSLTVPAGLYQLTVRAWGYEPATFANQRVITGALSMADFNLQPLPKGLLTGTLRRGSTPIVDARLSVAEMPSVQTISAADGSFDFSLPAGQHTIVVEAKGHRRITRTLTVPTAGATLPLQMEVAPTILLVNADASAGWFFGWPVHPFMAWALEQHGYLYDLWSIEYTHFIDQRTLGNGVVEYGIPSAQTMRQYDIVIWMHSGCSGFLDCWWGNPAAIGADGELSAYLKAGGRLLISGQEVGKMDGDRGFYDQLLRADVRSVDGGIPQGSGLTGKAFLEGINLTLTNASLYGSPNSASYFSPDMVTPAGKSVYPVLTYAGGEAAALAIAPCDAGYRAIYLAMGYENVAPYAQWQDPAISEVIARSVRWLHRHQDSADYQLIALSTGKVGSAGKRLFYDVQIENVGTQTLKIDLALAGNRWPVQIFEDGAPVQSSLSLTACHTRHLQIVVEIPADAANGDKDSFTLTTSTPEQPALASNTRTFTTHILPLWQRAASMLSNRIWMAATTMPGTDDLYTVGGLEINQFSWEFSSANHRYEGCTRTWEALAPLPRALVGASAGGSDGKLYVAGGVDSSAYSAALYIYDPGANTWSQGADLPAAQAFAASAVVDNRLYLFGGESYYYLDHTLIYDPASNGWSTGAPMPGGSTGSPIATAWNGEIYLLRGNFFSLQLSIYNPATNSWRTGASPIYERSGGLLAAASDGYLYLFGGSVYPDSKMVERYHPPTDTWEEFSSLQDGGRYGAVGAFVAGHLLVAGGFGYSNAFLSTESLTLTPNFCNSTVDIPQSAIEPGGEFTVRIVMRPDTSPLANARIAAPIPSDTTFGAFVENPLGALYNAEKREVEWQGALNSGPPQIIAYTLRGDASLQPGTRIQGEVTFDTGLGVQFARKLQVGVFAADFSASSKWASAISPGSGKRLTYTIELLSFTPIGGSLSLHDKLPTGTQYLPGSLSASTGVVNYDAVTHTIRWQGVVQPKPGATVNLSENYLWGDSDSRGDVADVLFNWTDIAGDGKRLVVGDAQFICDLDIGFPFSFYGKEYTNLCVHTDGYITFEKSAMPVIWSCTLPTSVVRAPLIAGLWTDLVVEGGVYARVVGSAPNRRLILQWDQAYRYGLDDSPTIDFQLVLSEGGNIQVQVLRAPTGLRDTVVGVQDTISRATTAYHCDDSGTFHNRLAVRFLAPNQSVATPRAQIQYSVDIDASLKPNTWVTNTVQITSAQEIFERHASVLVNPMDLGGSTLTVDRPEIKVGERIGVLFRLHNSGLATASGASLINALPASLSYLPDSILCSAGTCGASGNVISWTGAIPPQQEVTVAYSATLTTLLADSTPVTVSAQLDDGQGSILPLSASFVARQAELSASFVEIEPAIFHPGDVVTYTIFLYNSGGDSANVEMIHALPLELTYQPDSVVCGAGQCAYVDGKIEWQGTLPPRTMVPVRFRMATPLDIARGAKIVSVVTLKSQDTQVEYSILAAFDVARQIFLPLARMDIWRYYLPWVGRE
ncbi:MAG: S8 family serine peptidase [Caldilineaceae bacterium]|nr:S8 family serine peptidase [Caldilineaceae bacterium]